MSNHTVRRYTQNDFRTWNTFIGNAANASFLFHRDFMDYHADRFADFSLMVFRDDTLEAVLPANRNESEIHSHQGLTYGGVVTGTSVKGSQVGMILEAILNYLRECGMKKFYLRPIPWLYHRKVVGELDYFLHQNGTIVQREMNLFLNFRDDFQVSKSKMKHFRRVSDLDIEVRKEHDFEPFWDEVLIPRLREKYGASPVHSKQEIALLASRFSDTIFQYNVYSAGTLIAGITVFDFGNGIKSQYGATTKEGEKLRALDFLFISLIEEFSSNRRFFDMGTVTSGEGFNDGLLNQKLELGCSVFTLDKYLIEL